jgi:hypothetical protein
MRRIMVFMFAFAAILAGGSTATLGEEPTPGGAAPQSALAHLGYPELHVTVTSEGLDAPTEVPAGRVLLTVENTRETATIVAPIRLAEGDTIEAVVASAEGTGSGNDALVPYNDATWAGGAPAMPGETFPGMVINLTPGTWYILDASDLRATPPSFTVTGNAAPDTSDLPAAAVSIEMTDFQFVMPDRIEAGTHVWKFTNSGEQLHDIHVLQVPAGTTPDEVLTALTRPEGANPAPGTLMINETMIPMFGFGIMSADQTTWTDVTIESGTYVIVTWMSDEVTGVPQLTLGMLSVFTVVESGQTGPLPASPVPVAPAA